MDCHRGQVRTDPTPAGGERSLCELGRVSCSTLGEIKPTPVLRRVLRWRTAYLPRLSQPVKDPERVAMEITASQCRSRSSTAVPSDRYSGKSLQSRATARAWLVASKLRGSAVSPLETWLRIVEGWCLPSECGDLTRPGRVWRGGEVTWREMRRVGEVS
jgi:hypothetical protein